MHRNIKAVSKNSHGLFIARPYEYTDSATVKVEIAKLR